ncbi:hypothetical protein [Nocardia sp. NPDC004860]|uniref:hypothetical protein n=1 Tax=Nocardia sp. NPDC004860 TaxID=3154557 RepID=UPI0033BD5A6C
MAERRRTIIDWSAIVRGTAQKAIAQQLTVNDWEDPKEPAEAALVDFADTYHVLLDLLGGDLDYAG